MATGDVLDNAGAKNVVCLPDAMFVPHPGEPCVAEELKTILPPPTVVVE